MNPDIEILSKIWFGTDPPVGIVIAKNKENTLRAYIKPVVGNNEENDVEDIIDWGRNFPVGIARLLNIYINGNELKDTENDADMTVAECVANVFDISRMIKKDTTDEELGKELRAFVEGIRVNGNKRSLLVG